MKYEGIAYNRDGGEDSADVKYVDAYNQFISVATAARMSKWCYINVRTSYDGKYFRNESVIKHLDQGSNLVISIHNMGISGDAQGHIDIFKQNYVAFAYHPDGADWGKWPTRFVPIVWYGTKLYDNSSSIIQYANGTAIDKQSAPPMNGVRVLGAWNSRHLRPTSTSERMYFFIQAMDSNGWWEEIPMSEYSKVVFDYNPSKVAIDIANKTMTLLVPEVVTIKVSYKDKSGFCTIVPDFAVNSRPVSFYPEKAVVTFTRKGEVKQPAFVAKSVSGDYLCLWGNLSSFTDANTKDQQEYMKRWNQTVSLSGWDSRIISVDTATGKITAKAVGETTITATFMGHTAKVKIVVEVV
jgi:hypothetical protein